VRLPGALRGAFLFVEEAMDAKTWWEVERRLKEIVTLLEKAKPKSTMLPVVRAFAHEAEYMRKRNG